jgi:hypothetical protein
MTGKASEGPEAAAPPDPEYGEERRVFSYQGSRVPLFVVLIWAAFFVWGVIYLLRWIPESWREWFSR